MKCLFIKSVLIVFLASTTISQKQKQLNALSRSGLRNQGSLYEEFKTRLDKVLKESKIDPENLPKASLPTVLKELQANHTAILKDLKAVKNNFKDAERKGESQPPKFSNDAIKNFLLKGKKSKVCTDQAFKTVGDSLENPVDRIVRHSPEPASCCLYEACRQRLENFSRDLDIDPGTIIKRTPLSDNLISDGLLNQLLEPQVHEDSAVQMEDKLIAPYVDEDYLKYHNYHRIYSGRQPTQNGGFVNSDYDYNEHNPRDMRIYNPRVSRPNPNLQSEKNSLKAMDRNCKATDERMGKRINANQLKYCSYATDNIRMDDAYIRRPHKHKLPKTAKTYRHAIREKAINQNQSKHQKRTENQEAEKLNLNARHAAKDDESTTPETTITAKEKSDVDSIKIDCADENDPTPSPDSPAIEVSRQSDQEPITKEQSDRINFVLEKLLRKIESMEMEKNGCLTPNDDDDDDGGDMEGAPCPVDGSWISQTQGVRFDISLNECVKRGTSPNGLLRNKPLTITVLEDTPSKRHDVIDGSWRFSGSTMHQYGGPFHMFGQKCGENLMATFTGYCRVCGCIDTIFGSWSFHYPSKDCHDISTSIQTRRDIFRRLDLDGKREERFKDILLHKSKYYKGVKLNGTLCDF